MSYENYIVRYSSNFIDIDEDLSKSRKVYDNIYGFISFPERIWKFIDTPIFQRLRKIKQVANLHYVFPSANHTRF